MNCPLCGAPLPAGSGFCSGCGTPVAAAGKTARRSAVSAVLKGLAITAGAGLLIAGIIAAVAIPNLINAAQRGKQKRMMGELKSLSTAVESYQVDNHHYPVASNIGELCKALTPDYASVCMRQDIWSTEGHPHPFAYAAWGGTPESCPPVPDASDAAASAPSAPAADIKTGAGGCGPAHFALACAGRDGKWEVADFSGYDARDTDRFGGDIVIMDGQFVRYPYHKQRNRATRDAHDRPPGPPPEDFVPPPVTAHQLPE